MKINKKQLEHKTKKELITIIEKMETELRLAKKDAQRIRREINRMKKTLKHIKVRYDELIDIVEQEEIDKFKIEDLKEKPTTCQCPKCKSENLKTIDLNFLFKKYCLDCNHVMEKIYKQN